MPARDPAGVVGLFVGGVGQLKGEQGALFENEELRSRFASHEQRGERGKMGLVAHDRDISPVLGVKVEPLGDFAGIVLGHETGDLDAQRIGEEKPGRERVGGLAGTKERTVPNLGGTKHAAGSEKAGEPGDFGSAARTQRTRRVLFFGEGVGVAHKVEEHGDD